jgi:hypothetical protein
MMQLMLRWGLNGTGRLEEGWGGGDEDLAGVQPGVGLHFSGKLAER